MRRTRILYLTPISEIGGSDMTLLRAVQALPAHRYELHMAFPKDGPLVSSFQQAGVTTHILPMRKLQASANPIYYLDYLAHYWPTVQALKRLIRRLQIDIVHTNSLHCLYGFAAARAASCRHLWHIRELPVKFPAVRWLEVQLVRRFSDRIITMSEPISDLFRDSEGHLPAQLVKLWDGIDLTAFRPDLSGERIRRELGIIPDAPLVGMVTRLDPWKGVHVFLAAAARVLAAEPTARFLVAGGPIEGREAYAASLQTEAERLGVTQAVLFTGWRYRHQDIPAVFRALDVHVHAAILPEPYGLVNLEAMASGTPLVATRHGGTPELVQDGETGLLVPHGDPEALAGSILRLLQSPEARRRLALRGRLRAERYFDVRASAARYDALYQQAVRPQE